MKKKGLRRIAGLLLAAVRMQHASGHGVQQQG